MHHTAFLSEWGNNALDFSKKGPSGILPTTHFIVTALIIGRADVENVLAVLKAVSKRHFDGGQIDSEKTGNNHIKRKEVLEDLEELPFQVFSVIIDKRQLIGEGLRYKGSFFKFLHGLADRELFRIFPDLEMVADRTGDETFMKGFISYVQQNHIANLFNESSFGFVAANDSPIVQLAHFIAGTLARCYDETEITDQRGEFIQILKRKVLTIRFWPDAFAHNLINQPQPGPSFDPLLSELSVNLANDFLHRKSVDKAPQAIDQVSSLSYLLFHFRHISPTRYITSFELIEHIRARRGKNVSLHYFQTKVIAPLRDAGVLIASSSRGYKLPASQQDLYDFIGHSNTIIEPMLSRVKRFRDQIYMATDGKIDVLAADEYKVIRKVID
ncbi:DUF3800 domain-containing protein [Dyadobacter psychrophilus]|uniref:DUF3800 domain-containing protein n=1 Tax=Dyadobacter psychrophilus TaxID=651661 RepID=A0A1T5HG27_9BACT|nr:DUF3800 domain-containing protein [Dyadobacter psychrophilus]SKC19594.1 Protein of unknown function [Dyadobacter psychrophilus]